MWQVIQKALQVLAWEQEFAWIQYHEMEQLPNGEVELRLYDGRDLGATIRLKSRMLETCAKIDFPDGIGGVLKAQLTKAQ